MKRAILIGVLAVAMAAASLLAVGFAFRRSRLAASERPVVTTLPLDVHPALRWAKKAWLAAPYDQVGWPEGRPLVRVLDPCGNPLLVQVLDRDEARGEVRQLQISMGLGSLVQAPEVVLLWHGDDEFFRYGPYTYARDLRGTVTIDANRPPVPGEDRVIAYDLQGRRGDTWVTLQGRIRVSADAPQR